MRLLHLSVTDFRNLAQVELTPSRRATVTVGRNGQGKTNLLEAIYFLATLKPLRANRLAELVRFGQSVARVTGRFLLGGAERENSVEVAPPSRTAFVDTKRAQTLEDYFGGVSVVAFTPDDLGVVKGGPDGRRAFLDRAVFNRFPAFLKESREYARAVKGRNRLLKMRGAPSYLDAYDAALAPAGARVWTRRRALLAELAPRAEAAFERIGRTPSPARFVYEAPQLEPFSSTPWAEADEAALSAALLEQLGVFRARDLERGFTSVGPHTDDLRITLDDIAARAYASQGQQRALVLAWKMAEVENLLAVLGRLPLLLLDDVSSELDPDRNGFLLDLVANRGAQTFLTTTDASLVRAVASKEAAWFEMEAGVLKVCAEPISGVVTRA